jgi:hypothetical protein
MTQGGAHAISASTSGCAPLRLSSRLGFAAKNARSSAIFGAVNCAEKTAALILELPGGYKRPGPPQRAFVMLAQMIRVRLFRV